MALHKGGDFVEFHIEADVRFVAAIVIHSVVPAHSRNRVRDGHVQHILEKSPHHSLEGVEHVFLLHEGHFAVDLGEFRLAVSSEVLVTETAHDLEVAVVTGHHKQLLEGLRRLRKGVELSRIHSGRHHEIPGSLRSGFDEIRSLDFKEGLGIEIVADFVRNLVPQFESLAQRVAAKVEVAVFRTEFLSAVADILNRERRGLCLVQDLEFSNFDFYVSGRHLGVLAGTLYDLSGGLYHEFPSERSGCLHEFSFRGVDDQLGDAVAVAQVYESHTSEFAAFLHPPGESDGFACIFYAELSASMCSVHIFNNLFSVNQALGNMPCPQKSSKIKQIKLNRISLNDKN